MKDSIPQQLREGKFIVAEFNCNDLVATYVFDTRAQAIAKKTELELSSFTTRAKILSPVTE